MMSIFELKIARHKTHIQCLRFTKAIGVFQRQFHPSAFLPPSMEKPLSLPYPSDVHTEGRRENIGWHTVREKMRKPFNYDMIQIGEVLGEQEVLLTDAMIRTCAQAIESSHPWYFEDSPYGGRLAPPTIFDNDTLRMLDEQYERFGNIHAKQAWEFFSPARLGTQVRLTVRVIDKYIRRNRPYLVMELVAVDEDGLTLCRSTHTSLMTLQKG
jgi:hypothetical protein